MLRALIISPSSAAHRQIPAVAQPLKPPAERRYRAMDERCVWTGTAAAAAAANDEASICD